MSDSERRVGVDVGGTFTDVVVADSDGIRSGKVPSTPAAPDEGVAEGVASLLGERPLGDAAFFGHGTTHATNAVLETEWAETALVTTAGVRDALEIGRQDRPDPYDLHATRPDPIVPRDRRFEVPERLDETGSVVRGLDETAARETAEAVADADPDAVAVCLLFAFENDAHERRVRTLLRDAGVEAPISLSSAVHPEIREYERTVTTALNAALVPAMGAYLDRLETWAADAGLDGEVAVVGSNGGLRTAGTVRDRPVETLLSGPAAGVRGAAAVASASGIDDCVTMDMGGTSCDVSLVTDGAPARRRTTDVGDYPVGVPSVDVHTVGAGGGSIAWVDDGGALRVGPRSAGADPGPVCYDRGGTRPTVTDAQVLLGRIDPDAFAGDAGRDAVRAAIADGVGRAVDGDATAVARGVVDVATAAMTRALRVVTVERGHDPRDRTLVAFGGAGPLHATAVAAGLDVPRVLLPGRAGVLSAVGIVAGDVLYDERRSRVRAWRDVDPDALDAAYTDLESAGDERLDAAGVPPDDRRIGRLIDLRYAGQAHELTVDVPERLDSAAIDTIADRFHDRHRDRYGHAARGEPLECVTLRVRARGLVDPPSLGGDRDAADSVAGALCERRPVVFERERETPVYGWTALPGDGRVDGPAVVEGPDSTALLRPTDTATVTDDGSLLVEVGS